MNNDVDSLVIYSGSTARYLLKMGYTVIDIKADKANKVKSVFIFRRENRIENDMREFLRNNKDNVITKELEIKDEEQKNVTEPENN
jgi:hypothetical protein